MVTFIPQEEIIMNWSDLSAALEKFWDSTINFETLPNLKRRLLANQCQLWLYTNPDQLRVLFVTEITRPATANILTITHTAGFNLSGKRFKRADLSRVFNEAFDAAEKLAKDLGLDALCIHARPGHVKLAKGFKVWTTSIIKQFKE
jgi:hypothetical protein